MVFSSLLFLYAFLPVCLLLYFLVPGLTGKNIVLLCASLVFYAWGEPVYVFLMLAVAALNWGFGLLLEKRPEKLWLALCVALNLASLVVFKYAGFLVENCNALFGAAFRAPQISLPIGISFYTFQALSYSVDVYRKDVGAQRSYWKFLLYVSMFPQLIAGPIVRYVDVAAQIESRESDPENVCVGLGKKVLLAGHVGQVADQLLGGSFTGATTLGIWLGALMYMFQIYFDFSGYSDMAIGLGRIFGFRYMENFKLPYTSKSITEFWRRWHISLSTWFRDYLYIPLGGNRKGLGRTCVNLFIVFLATGLWHGASMTFIIWGIYHGLFILSERLWLKKVLDRNPVKFLNHLYAMVVVVFGWLLFRAPSMTYAIDLAKAMIRPSKGLWNAGLFANNKILFLAVLGILLCGPVQALFPRFRNHIFDEENVSYGDIAVMIVLLFLSTMVVVSSTYTAFIYFQF